MTELITEDEIKLIKSNSINLSITNLQIVKPYTLKSGYKIGYSIDQLLERKARHISICRSDHSKADPADEEEIVSF